MQRLRPARGSLKSTPPTILTLRSSPRPRPKKNVLSSSCEQLAAVLPLSAALGTATAAPSFRRGGCGSPLTRTRPTAHRLGYTRSKHSPHRQKLPGRLRCSQLQLHARLLPLAARGMRPPPPTHLTAQIASPATCSARAKVLASADAPRNRRRGCRGHAPHRSGRPLVLSGRKLRFRRLLGHLFCGMGNCLLLLLYTPPSPFRLASEASHGAVFAPPLPLVHRTSCPRRVITHKPTARHRLRTRHVRRCCRHASSASLRGH